MSWTAIVPLKQGGLQKSRLAERLSPEERAALSAFMSAHVVEQLLATAQIERTIILSPAPAADPRLEWAQDNGGGLNAELSRLRDERQLEKVAVVHGDLPLLASVDIAALLAAAEMSGCAIAPDRHGAGTNALALADAAPFNFQFGWNSCPKHHAQRPDAAIVRLPGLQHDLDTPDDLDAAIGVGFIWPQEGA